MSDQNVLPSPPIETPPGLAAWRDELILKIASVGLKHIGEGRLRLTLPSGRAAVIGTDGTDIDASIDVRSFNVIPGAMRRGSLGFAESYLNGDVATENLGNVFRFFIANFEALNKASRGLFRSRVMDRLAHVRRRNTRAGSRRNISEHYDLGNDFYELWLDPSMTYSSALFDSPDMSLSEAQDAKYAKIIDALDLDAPGHVLEIGCGWGGMAERLAKAGHKVTAVTISSEQLKAAETRIANAGLSEQVDVRFQDYRDIDGMFDRIVSVEMIEAVGASHWPQYFRTLSDRLLPGGHAVLQAITINSKDYPGYASRPDFIQRYIFPGGMLPTEDIMSEQAKAHGMQLETVTTFGPDYAETLRQWRQSFEEAWPRIAALGFDERFRRMWNYYLTYCEVGFDTGVIDVGIYKVAKGNS